MSQKHRQRGFTVVEMVIVMGIIVVLASMLIPTVAKMRANAMAAKCQGNVHAIMSAFLLFASDHDGCLPGADRGGPGGGPCTPWQYDWLEGQTMNFWTAPQAGTIYTYINDASVYVCPSMDTDRNLTSDVTDEYASNGRFDYGFFTLFNGAPIRTIPLRSQMNLLSGGFGWYPTPIVCQEDGARVNGTDIEGDHSNIDQMTHIHNGGGYYGSVDGSVTWVIEPDQVGTWNNGCWQWWTMGPQSHAPYCLGNPYQCWGSWLND